MSTGWKDNPANARDELINALLCGAQHWMAAGEDPEEANRVVDAFAHELAEKIRSDPYPENGSWDERLRAEWMDGKDTGADLIDPEEAGV